MVKCSYKLGSQVLGSQVLGGQVRSVLAALRPVRLEPQLIHGDLGGNVLFAEGEPPLVYRLVTELIFRRDDGPGLEAAARVGQPVTDLVLARLALG